MKVLQITLPTFLFTITMAILTGCQTTYGANQLKPNLEKQMTAWYSTPTDERGNVSVDCQKVRPFRKNQIKTIQKQVWDAYKQGAIALEWDKVLPPLPAILEQRLAIPKTLRGPYQSEEIEQSGKKMPFYLLVKGEASDQGRPLFISLHGGGRSSKKVSPHGWSVNNREWQVQTLLFERVFSPGGIYFLPRMADDNDGRWWYSYCQQVYDRVIRYGILFRGVDPNRVYIMGISEGGYGVYSVGPFMPDRFAGVGAMAAGANSIAENLRNTPFRTDVGEKDTMFGRQKLATAFHKQLDELKKSDPTGYPAHLEVQKGKGHGIDYRANPKWLAKHTRNPYPEKIVWTAKKLHGQWNHRNYWLGIEKPLAKGKLYLTAQLNKKTNTITITAKQDAPAKKGETKNKDKNKNATPPQAMRDNTITVYLNDKLLNLDRTVTVLCNGKRVYRGKVKRTLENMMTTLADRGDPYYIFPGKIEIEMEK